MKIRNSLISNNRSFDADKFSYTQMIPEKGNNSINDNQNKVRKSKKVTIKIIDENNEQDKTNASKSLVQSSLLVKNKNKNPLQSSQMSYGLAREMQNIIWHISCCKKIIMFFLIIIIIAQIVAIPIIIYNSYSY